MKIYNFRVKVEETNQKVCSLMDKIVNEAKDEQYQSKITEKINKKTTEIHTEILSNYVEEINKELNQIGLVGFVLIEKYFATVNSYRSQQSAACQISYGENGNTLHELVISGIADREFKDSQYTTFTGDYKITLNNRNVKTVYDIIDLMKDSIKKHLIKQ